MIGWSAQTAKIGESLSPELVEDGRRSMLNQVAQGFCEGLIGHSQVLITATMQNDSAGGESGPGGMSRQRALSDARFSRDENDPALPVTGLLQPLIEPRQLLVATHEADTDSRRKSAGERDSQRRRGWLVRASQVGGRRQPIDG